jgi:hypothetical protein
VRTGRSMAAPFSTRGQSRTESGSSFHGSRVSA